MIIAGKANFRFIQGCTFEALELQMLDADGAPVNITGMTAEAEIRLACGDPVIYDLTPSVTDGPNGILTIPEVAKTVTAALAEEPNSVWDLLLSDGADRQQMLKGKWPILCKITDSD